MYKLPHHTASFFAPFTGSVLVSHAGIEVFASATSFFAPPCRFGAEVQLRVLGRIDIQHSTLMATDSTGATAGSSTSDAEELVTPNVMSMVVKEAINLDKAHPGYKVFLISTSIKLAQVIGRAVSSCHNQPSKLFHNNPLT